LTIDDRIKVKGKIIIMRSTYCYLLTYFLCIIAYINLLKEMTQKVYLNSVHCTRTIRSSTAVQ